MPPGLLAVSDCSGKKMVSAYQDKFEQSVRPKLDLLDKIRNLLNKETDIDLPAVVVIGDQSSGKSSVLEALSHINLPRGEGIVTR